MRCCDMIRYVCQKMTHNAACDLCLAMVRDDVSMCLSRARQPWFRQLVKSVVCIVRCAMQCYSMQPCATLCYATIRYVSVLLYQELLRAMLSYGVLCCCMPRYGVRCAAPSDAGANVAGLIVVIGRAAHLATLVARCTHWSAHATFVYMSLLHEPSLA